MTFLKSQRWLLVSAAALVLPATAVTWWMLTPDAPQTAAFDLERTLSGSDAELTDDLTQADTAPLQTNKEHADGTAQRKADADDFQQYAQTLRAQNQPEKTVRELLSSRITAAFQVRRAALRNHARRDDTMAAQLDARLAALNHEQDALIAQFAASEEQLAVHAVNGTQTLATDTTPAGAEKQILAPAVLAETLPATVKTEEQAAAWEKLRNDFVKSIGGENQDPANPNYRKRWVQAQSEADQRFRLQFGDTAFVQHQMQAQREAALQQENLSK